jgi:hypothetical protein
VGSVPAILAAAARSCPAAFFCTLVRVDRFIVLATFLRAPVVLAAAGFAVFVGWFLFVAYIAHIAHEPFLY